MVGIFSRFSASSRASHRRTQSAILRFLCFSSMLYSWLQLLFFQDERVTLPPNSEASGAGTAAATASHGIEVAVEFNPVEHPMQPLDNDRPIQCPVPEPSILNDGRFWKKRVSATVPRRGDLPVMMEGVSHFFTSFHLFHLSLVLLLFIVVPRLSSVPAIPTSMAAAGADNEE